VKKVLPEFLRHWDTPDKLLSADVDDIKKIVAPLGIANIRTKRLLGMSRDFLTWDHKNAINLYGIGKYGSDSYEIFFKNNYSVEPTDKELKKFLEERKTK
jgi:methyl-CpG-binding domain protein 4